MYKDLRHSFWWDEIKKDIVEFVQNCLMCQQVKAEHLKPSELLVSLPVSEWKWVYIIMKFVTGFSRTSQGYDVIWVVIDRLIKYTHFLPIQIKYSMDKLARVSSGNSQVAWCTKNYYIRPRSLIQVEILEKFV